MKKSPRKNHRKLSPEDLSSAIGSTWFSLEEQEDRFVLDTREHGDVGSERPGKADLAEAKRMVAAVRHKFPRHEVKAEAVDEWVILEVFRNEKSKERLEREERDRLAARLGREWTPHVEAAISMASQGCLGSNAQSKNYAAPFSWLGTVSPGSKSCATSFRAEYGVRHLYRDQQGAIPAFATPGEVREHFSKFISQLGGTIKAEKVNPPWKKLTYNYSPPNNVIEEVGHVSYDVELPLTPPGARKSLSKGGSTIQPKPQRSVGKIR